jgi:hypothetical protein
LSLFVHLPLNVPWHFAGILIVDTASSALSFLVVTICILCDRILLFLLKHNICTDKIVALFVKRQQYDILLKCAIKNIDNDVQSRGANNSSDIEKLKKLIIAFNDDKIKTTFPIIALSISQVLFLKLSDLVTIKDKYMQSILKTLQLHFDNITLPPQSHLTQVDTRLIVINRSFVPLFNFLSEPYKDKDFFVKSLFPHNSTSVNQFESFPIKDIIVRYEDKYYNLMGDEINLDHNNKKDQLISERQIPQSNLLQTNNGYYYVDNKDNNTLEMSYMHLDDQYAVNKTLYFDKFKELSVKIKTFIYTSDKETPTLWDFASTLNRKEVLDMFYSTQLMSGHGDTAYKMLGINQDASQPHQELIELILQAIEMGALDMETIKCVAPQSQSESVGNSSFASAT